MCDDDETAHQATTAVVKRQNRNSIKKGGMDNAEDEDDAHDPQLRTAACDRAVRHYGCFFAILPKSPTIPPSALKHACEMVVVDELFVSRSKSKSTVDDDDDDDLITAFTWTHDRVEDLYHPQLPDPLPYLEISGILTLKMRNGEVESPSNDDTRRAEQVCQEMIVNALLSKQHEAVVGNAELLLVLADTAIPVMDKNIPILEQQQQFNNTVGSGDIKQLFHTWGVVIINDAVCGDEDDLVELETHTMRTFQQLYSALLHRTDQRKHFKEIMARDENRFDFRLDCGGNTAAGVVDDMDESSAVWKRLGKIDGLWVPVVRELLGDDCVLIRCGCVLSLHGTGVQYWHSDGVHVGASLSLGDDAATAAAAAAPVHALCVFVPLIDLDESTGYTEFWAGSHQYAKLLSKKGEQALPGGNKGIVRRGSCLLYDYRTIHRGMPNSSGKARPVTYFLYTRAGFEFVEDQNFTETNVYEA